MMASKEHLRVLEKGTETWNVWREENPDVAVDLSGANLRGADLQAADLQAADLSGACLDGADLRDANLLEAYLEGAELNGARMKRAALELAYLIGASLEVADLDGADLGGANLRGARLQAASLGATNLRSANLEEANLTNALLFETIFANVDLSKTIGLSACNHLTASTVDHRTITRSKNVPLVFWRGCGLPDALIDYAPSLRGDAIRFYSCFISYSSKDQEFADRLHADLQDKGVRCWFAPHDLPIGAKILDGIDEAIRLREKVVLILSEGAIASDWVEDEVTTAFEEERRRGGTMLFPIRLDDAVMESGEAWASKLRARNVGDFTRWKEHDAYKATFERVLRDLKKAS